MGASERNRKLDPREVANYIKSKLTEWDVPDLDVLWAIQKGGAKPNDKRSKKLMAASWYGGSRIVPYDGDWYSKGNGALIDALNLIEMELKEKIA